jgi:hypothetical protein
MIPQGNNAGDLIMIPNCRSIRLSYLRNTLDQLLVDNKLSQRLLRYAYKHRRMGFTQVKIIPGSLYLFWGYRSLHANEACDPEQIQATALFHFVDPYADSSLRNVTGQAKVRAL